MGSFHSIFPRDDRCKMEVTTYWGHSVPHLSFIINQLDSYTTRPLPSGQQLLPVQ